MTQASNDFIERVRRINAGALNTKHTMFVGMEDRFNVPVSTYPVPRRGSVLSLPFGFGLGAAGSGLAVLVAFHLFGMADAVDGTDHGLLLQAALGLAIAYLMGWMCRQRGIVAWFSQTAGVATMLWALPLAMHIWPVPFAIALSPDLADQVRTALPAQVSFAGYSVNL